MCVFFLGFCFRRFGEDLLSKSIRLHECSGVTIRRWTFSGNERFGEQTTGFVRFWLVAFYNCAKRVRSALATRLIFFQQFRQCNNVINDYDTSTRRVHNSHLTIIKFIEETSSHAFYSSGLFLRKTSAERFLYARRKLLTTCNKIRM